jgi:hypothetical protein
MDVQTGDIKYGDVMTNNHHILADVMQKGRNESREVLIQGRYDQGRNNSCLCSVYNILKG